MYFSQEINKNAIMIIITKSRLVRFSIHFSLIHHRIYAIYATQIFVVKNQLVELGELGNKPNNTHVPYILLEMFGPIKNSHLSLTNQSPSLGPI